MSSQLSTTRLFAARLITIGTEITSGEIVNTNATWISHRLEESGVRVLSHLTVRDESDEILAALNCYNDGEIWIVSGGLGPTTDDRTRECLARFAGVSLEFDGDVWQQLQVGHAQRGLKILPAHRHQCYFPAGAKRLANPVGTALGFELSLGIHRIFVLPGPPRELEGVWKDSVDPAVRAMLPGTTYGWKKWTCIGVPESEVAETVEPIVAGLGIETGYRASVPYVKVKVYVDSQNPKHQDVVNQLEKALAVSIVTTGDQDLAEEFLSRWPAADLTVVDKLSDDAFCIRLIEAKKKSAGKTRFSFLNELHEESDIKIWPEADQFHYSIPKLSLTGAQTLPYKIPLTSERGKKAAVEWVLWACVKKLRASSLHP